MRKITLKTVKRKTTVSRRAVRKAVAEVYAERLASSPVKKNSNGKINKGSVKVASRKAK